jgi:hypothetical protein
MYQKLEYGERHNRMYHIHEVHQLERRNHVQSLEFCNWLHAGQQTHRYILLLIYPQ